MPFSPNLDLSWFQCKPKDEDIRPFCDDFVNEVSFSNPTLTLKRTDGTELSVDLTGLTSTYTDVFNYTSGVTHNITHNLNNLYPVVTVWDNNNIVITTSGIATIQSIDSNNVGVTLNATLSNIKITFVG